MATRSEPPAILISGAHRSGTTWVGRVLGASPTLLYIHEPFHPLTPPHPGIFAARVPNWFLYLTANSEAPFEGAFRRMLGLRYGLGAALRTARTGGGLVRVAREARRFLRARRAGARALVKDPIALFAAEWLADRFGMRILILIRHPAAFAASLKRLDWQVPFDQFLAQPDLMRDHLWRYEAEIREFNERKADIVDQAALQWKLLYHVVDHYRRAHPDWIFVRHEDLSRDPVAGFQALTQRLEVPLDSAVAQAIGEYSDPSHPVDAPEGVVFKLKRDSRSMARAWKNSLSGEEIARIRARVEGVASSFYADGEW